MKNVCKSGQYLNTILKLYVIAVINMINDFLGNNIFTTFYSRMQAQIVFASLPNESGEEIYDDLECKKTDK